MRVEFEFDQKKVIKNGYKKESIYYTIKKAFAKYNLPCISEGDVLAFEDCGRESDFANLWIVIMRLVRADWFIKTAARCDWFPREDRREDVLSKARRDFKQLSY